MHRLAAALPLALTLLAALSACRRNDPVVLDFGTALPWAEVLREPRALDPGDADAAHRFVRGWWLTVNRASPRLWGIGAASELALDVNWVRPLAFRFRAALAPGLDRAVGQLAAELNGMRLGVLDLTRQARDYELRLDAPALREGANRLVFRYLPSAPGSRQRIASWSRIRLGPDGPVPSPAGGPGRLEIPYGVRIDYHLRVPRRPRLALGGIETVGAAGGRLEVRLATDEGLRSRALVERPDDLARLEPLPPGRLARITLLALPPPDSPAAGGAIRLAAPVLRGRPTRPATTRPSPPPAVHPQRRREERPSIVVYLVDTLRRDAVSCYGGSDRVTPSMAAFCAGATVFENAVAQSSWTKPSVASILTGLWPLAHGVVRGRDALSPRALTLGERLAEAGYRSAAFSSNPNVTSDFGFDQGFETFRYLGTGASSSEVVRQAVSWLEANAGGAPVFLYVHAVDPHSPYTPPEAYRRRFAAGVEADLGRRSTHVLQALEQGKVPATPSLRKALHALYTAEVAASDASFGSLLAGLEESGLLASSLVVLVSDHGEEFAEHGTWRHRHDLHAETVDIPLVIKAPGQTRARRVAALAQHVDLLPTFLDYAGLPPDEGLEGRSLRPVLDGSPTPPHDREAFLYLDHSGRPELGLVAADWKLIRRFGGDTAIASLLYARDRDPGERDDLAARRPVLAGYLAARLRRLALAQGRQALATPARVDPALAESLRSLGYLD